MLNKKQILLTLAILTSIYASASAETGSVLSTTASTGSTSTGTQSTTVEVGGVDVIDPTTLSVKFSGALTNGISDSSEVKVFKDMKISKVEKDLDNPKKINISLDEELDFNGNTYSLFSVSSIDTSIDFDLTKTSSGKITNSTPSEEGIDYINVVDSKKVEVYLKKAPTSDLTDFKMLKEVKIASMFFDAANLNVKSQTPLTAKSNYFFMFIALKDNGGKEISVSNSMYDFTTPDFTATNVSTGSVNETSSGELIAPETTTSTSALTSSGETLSGSTQTGAMSLEEAAKKVTATPDTGAKTNILIALTLIASLGYFILRRKALKN